MGGAAGEINDNAENTTSHDAFAIADLEGEVGLRVVFQNRAVGQDREVADVIEATGMNGVGKVETGLFEACLEVGEVFG